MSESLRSFMREHPEFFEAHSDYWRLHKDISAIMQRYAQALDPEEYEQLRLKMEEVRIRERSRIQKEINEWLIDRSREEEVLKETEEDLRKLQAKLRQIEVRIDKARLAIEPVKIWAKQWYHSGLVYLCLALMGVVFLYLGIILNKRISPGYVISGLACIFMGFVLQRHPSANGSSEQQQRQLVEVTEEERRFMQITRIKKATLMERKKVANKSVSSLNAKIDAHLAKLEILNG